MKINNRKQTYHSKHTDKRRVLSKPLSAPSPFIQLNNIQTKDTTLDPPDTTKYNASFLDNY